MLASTFSACASLSLNALAQESTLTAPLYSKPIIADVSKDRVEIHAQFEGENVLLYGARNTPGDLIAVVTGPYATAKLARKGNVAGIWMQVERTKFKDIPLYFALASTKPLEDILDETSLKTLGITYPDMASASTNPMMVGALKAKLTERGWLNATPATIQYFGDTLFRTQLKFPSSMPRGNYTVDVFLVDRGEISAVQSIPLHAVKTGLDFWLYDTAHKQPWFYGLGAAFLSLLGGWLGNRLVRRR